MKIIGSYVSPYVRKVLACLALKDLAYEIDPITPFYGNEEFGRLSPLRRIPVLIDGDLTLCDSTVICAYLDEAYPGRPLLPAAPADRARARWFEEYADTRLGDLFIWGLFYQKIVHPIVWGEPGDQARIERTLNEDLPRELDYLETRAAGRRLAVRRDSASPTSRSPPSSATAPMPASRSMPGSGRGRRLSSPARSTIPPSPAYFPSRTSQRGTTPQKRREALVDAGAPLTDGPLAEREAAPGRHGALRN